MTWLENIIFSLILVIRGVPFIQPMFFIVYYLKIYENLFDKPYYYIFWPFIYAYNIEIKPNTKNRKIITT